MINNLHVEWVCRSEILLYNAWAQIRAAISCIIPNRQCAMATLLEGLKRLNNFYKPICLSLNPAHISISVCVGGVCEVWQKKNTPQMNRQKKICPVPPTFPSSCAILALLAVLLDCKKYLKAKSLSSVMTLCFDISCCGKSGLWLFWRIRVQTLHGVRPQVRQGRRDLPWWTDLIHQSWEVCWKRELAAHQRACILNLQIPGKLFP